jgi:transaldolase
MVCTTPTDFWNDSCAPAELEYAIGHGATGATTNPPIVLGVLKKDLAYWRARILEFAAADPTASETDVTWRLIEAMALRGAELLLPVFERHGGRKGRLSIQADPTLYRNAPAMAAQALRFHGLAPNLQVKLPVTTAGVEAIEEATRLGVNVNATVSFTVPQALAVAEAVERGLDRRAAEGADVSGMTPVCTIMVGRLDDWVQVLAERDGIVTDPGYLHRAGVAVFKKAYRLFKERGYRCRLLAAAYRHHLHWSELIGGDVILTMPCPWQKRFNASDIEVKPRIDDPPDPAMVAELCRKFPDFAAAWAEDGIPVEAFDAYGATRRTLRSFLKAYADLVGMVRDVLVPDPDVKGG